MAQAPQQVVVKITGDATELAAALKRVDAELATTVKQFDRAQAAMGSAVARNGFAGSARAAANANHALSKSTKQMRSQMQNVGYQLQDTVIQMEMGVHWTRVFAQQGSQVLGAFGPWPAILSAAAGAVLAIAYNMGMFSNEAKTAKEASDAFLESVSKVNDQLIILNSTDPAAKWGDMAVQVERLAHSMFELESAAAARNLISYFEALDRELNKQTFSENFLMGLRLLMPGSSSLAEAIKKGTRDETEFEKLGFAMALSTYEGYIAQLEASARSGDVEAITGIMADLVRDATAGGLLVDQVSDTGVEMLRILQQLTTQAAEQRAELNGSAQAQRDMLAAVTDTLPLMDKWLADMQSMSDVADDLMNAEWASRGADDLEVMSQAVQSMPGDLETARQNFIEIVERQKEMVSLAEDSRTAVKGIADATTGGATLMAQFAGHAGTLAINLWSALAAVHGMFEGVEPEKVGGGRGRGTEWEDTQRLNQYRKQLEDAANFGNGVRKLKGGGGGAPDQDELEKYREALRLKTELLRVDEDTATVRQALRNDFAKYSTAEIDHVIALTAEFRKMKEQIEEQQGLWDRTGSAIEDATMSMITRASTIKEAFSDMARSIVNELWRVLVLQRAIGGFDVASGTGTGLLGLIGGAITPGAKGMVVQPFASGGVVTSPTLFPMSSGAGLMGEAGAEAIMPLSRNSKGDLGVAGPSITVNNYSGAEVTVDRTEEVITIAVGRAVEATRADFSHSMATGQGAYARSMESNYKGGRKLY